MCMSLCIIFCSVVLFNGETDETLIVDIDAPRIHRSDQNIQSQIKFQSIYQKWILHILWNNALLIQGHLRDITDLYKKIHIQMLTYDINAFALAWIVWFYDPLLIGCGVLSLLCMEMIVEISKFIWEDIWVRYNIKGLFAEAFLHFYNIGN